MRARAGLLIAAVLVAASAFGVFVISGGGTFGLSAALLATPTPTASVGQDQGPEVPHNVQGRNDCRACHANVGLFPMPHDHETKANDSCLGCHKPTTVKIPEVLHPFKDKADCLGCHSQNLVPLPVSHAKRADNRMCTSCHDLSSKQPPALPHTTDLIQKRVCTDCHGPTGDLPQSETHIGHKRETDARTCTACHQARDPGPPAIVHAVEAGLACSSCHRGTALKALPESHSKRTDDKCTLCHEVKPKPAPLMAHDIQDRQLCTSCHTVDKKLAPLPAGHEGRTDTMCTLCHKPSPAGPPVIQHAIGTRTTDCTSCHVSVRVSVTSLAPTSAAHQDRSQSMCLLCHKVSPVQPPFVPHALTADRDNCRTCHSVGQLGALPASHSTRSLATCRACHEEWPAGVPAIPHKLDKRSNCADCHKPTSSRSRGGGMS